MPFAGLRWAFLPFAGLSTLVLSACNSVPVAGLQTLAAMMAGAPIRPPAAVAGVQFLRVYNAGSNSFLVLGDVDQGPAGPLQVWYSAGRQVLRLHQGRVAGSAGLTVDWTAVDWQGLPDSWSAAGTVPRQYLRVRDVMPGHWAGVRERVTLARITAPARPDIPGVAESEWRRWAWFTEEATPVDIEGRPLRGVVRLPPAVYAVDLGQPGEPVRYSRQCLAPDFCLEIQPWRHAGNAPQGSAPALQLGGVGPLGAARPQGRS
jgi:hypothetical protein